MKLFRITPLSAVLTACLFLPVHSFAQLSFSPRQAASLSDGSAVTGHGDFNNDGREDVTATVYNSSTQSYVAVIYLSTADGTYGEPRPLPAYVDAVGDFNGDGKLDYASTEFQSITIYLGNGDGTFKAAKTVPNGSIGFTPLLAADLNHDGKTDLVEVLGTAYVAPLVSLQLFISNGDGTFTKGQTIAASTGSLANQSTLQAVTGDFDGDGKPDVAVIYGSIVQNSQYVPVGSTIQIFYGDNAGHLGSPSLFADPHKYSDTAPYVADLNNDGKSDIVTFASPLSGGKTANGTFALFFGSGNRTVSYKTITNNDCAGPDNTGLTVADLNGDGLNDLAYTAVPCNSNSVATSVFVRLGTGSGNFGSEQMVYQNLFQLGTPLAIRSTLGTKPDLAFDQFNGTTLSSFELLTNTSTGNFPGCGLSGLSEGVQVCSPGTVANSPVKFSVAAAGPTPMRTAAVWVDGKKITEQLTHSFSNYSFLDASLPLTAGNHAITIYGTGWDDTLQERGFTLNVGNYSACPPVTNQVNLCFPANDSTITSPVTIVATSGITSLARMEVWIDGVKKYTETTSPSLTFTISLPAGSHRFAVFADDNTGGKTETISYATVK